MRKYLTIFFSSLCLFSIAQETRILIDDEFSDWQNVQVAHADPLGDQPGSFTDFGDFWIWNDDDFLFLRLKVNNEINLQDNNGISVYLDTDNDPATGFSVNGIGAELVYAFGNREGTVFSAQSSMTVDHHDIGLVSSPTITSTEFELAIRRDVQFFNQDLFSGNDIKIFWRNNELFGDKLPNDNEGVAYSFLSEIAGPLPPFSIDKTNSNHIRIMSYNVLVDGIFDASKVPSFTRLLQAAQPDIIGFQEIYGFNSVQTANQVETMLPSGSGEQWYHGKAGPDIILVSRYPILSVFPIEGVNQDQGNAAFLLDLNDNFGTEMLIVNAHTPCCANNVDRQEEVDAMMAFIRDAKAPGGVLTIHPNVPIVVMGDMNLVGERQQQTTLVTGDIINEGLYGPDFQPDWDNTAFEDSKPYSTGVPMAFTWYRENSAFSPGRLDYIIYSGSVMSLQNSYVLFTPGLPSDSLNAYNLFAGDATFASDHLPVVADFELDLPTAVSGINERQNLNLEVFPNPVSEVVTTRFSLEKSQKVVLKIIDSSGKIIATIIEEELSSGVYEFPFDVSGLSNGVYFVRLRTEFFDVSAEMILVR